MPKRNRVHLKNNGSSLDNDRSGSLSVDLNSDYLSKYVRFTFRDCNIGGDYGVCKTLRDQGVAKDLFGTLKEFEGMNWTTFMNRSRKTGWSQEQRNQPNYAKLRGEFPDYTHFGHIRIKSNSHKTFRIFCGRVDDMVAILKIDVGGKMNH